MKVNGHNSGKTIDLSTKLTINYVASVMKNFVYNFRKQFDVYLRLCLLFKKKQSATEAEFIFL